jgi:hypothetical protein
MTPGNQTTVRRNPADPDRLYFDFDIASPGGGGGASLRIDPARALASIDGGHRLVMTRAGGSTAAGNRFDEEGDWIVRQFIPPADLQRTPEEYVARNAHLLAIFSFHLYRFRDPDLGAWVRRAGELLGSEEEVRRCREMFLSPDELAIAQQQDSEDS